MVFILCPYMVCLRINILVCCVHEIPIKFYFGTLYQRVIFLVHHMWNWQVYVLVPMHSSVLLTHLCDLSWFFFNHVVWLICIKERDCKNLLFIKIYWLMMCCVFFYLIWWDIWHNYLKLYKIKYIKLWTKCKQICNILK